MHFTKTQSSLFAEGASRPGQVRAALLGIASLVVAAPLGADMVNVRASGSIEYACEIGLGDEVGSSMTLDYDPVDRSLAEIDIRCNDPDGFRFEIATANDFVLVGGQWSIPYRLRLSNSPGARLDGVAAGGGYERVVEEFVEAFALGASVDVVFEMVGNVVVPGGVEFADDITFEVSGL